MQIPIYTQEDVQKKLTDMNPICGIKEYTLENGGAEGVKVAELYNGSGLRFAVLKNRGLDIAEASFRGVPLHFQSFGGVTAPSQGYNRGDDFLRCFYGGLLVTCGITHNGRPSQDGGRELGLHGRYSNLRARVHTVRAEWEKGGYVLEVAGDVRETALFGPHVSLQRSIRTSWSEPCIVIEDIFTNHHNRPTLHSMLYHFSFGYPLVDEGAELVYNAMRVTGLPDNARHVSLEEIKRVPAPLREHGGEAQDFYYLDVTADAVGTAVCGVINRRLGLGVKLEYEKAKLPRLGNWLHFGEGEYVVAFEPMNSGVEGRVRDRELGWTEEIAPGGIKTYCVKLTVLSTSEELEAMGGIASTPS